MQQTLGYSTALFSAFFFAGIAVLTRRLKEVPTSIILWYHTLAAVLILFVGLLIEAVISGNGLRMASYTYY